MSTQASRERLRSQLDAVYEDWRGADLRNPPEEFMTVALDTIAAGTREWPRWLHHQWRRDTRQRAMVLMLQAALRTWRQRRRAAARGERDVRPDARPPREPLTVTCAICHRPFDAERPTARTCSPACRQRAYRQRRTTTASA